MLFNHYSILTPPGGLLYFSKIINLLNILLFTDCKNKEIFDFIHIPNIMCDAIRVNHIKNIITLKLFYCYII
jgi:hypothetical protein